MDYIVLFDVASKPRPWFWALVLVLASVAALFMGRRNAPDASERTRWASLALSRMFVVGATIALFAGGYTYEANRQRMLADLIRGDVSIVEGVISKVVKKRTMRNNPECFTVESRSFCYRDNLMTPAFNIPIRKGGPIREGLWIRVTHQGESILRLETTRSAYDRAYDRANVNADRK